MSKLISQTKDLLENELNNGFPKGECKERGPALVLFARAMGEISRIVKAFGGCEKCYGKGYGTQTVYTTAHADFIGDVTVHRKMPTMVFCECERGKQLEKLLTSSYKV